MIFLRKVVFLMKIFDFLMNFNDFTTKSNFPQENLIIPIKIKFYQIFLREIKYSNYLQQSRLAGCLAGGLAVRQDLWPAGWPAGWPSGGVLGESLGGLGVVAGDLPAAPPGPLFGPISGQFSSRSRPFWGSFWRGGGGGAL